jgi:hypothetical protein
VKIEEDLGVVTVAQEHQSLSEKEECDELHISNEEEVNEKQDETGIS